MQDQKFTLPYPSLQVRAGVLVADGYGISLRVPYGKLRIEDGTARVAARSPSIARGRASNGPQPRSG